MYSELDVNPRNYTKSFPNFSKPSIIGYIGLENLKFARQVKDDNRVSFDLNLHIDNAIRKPFDLDVKLTDLLKFLLDSEKRLKMDTAYDLEAAKFFCFRGLLTCIACTPYENSEPWKIVAILYKGNIYLCARITEERMKRLRNMSVQERICTSWGFKFEQFMLSESPDDAPNPNVPVDETAEFSLVFTTNLNQHKILYGAEMDGVRCDDDYFKAPPKDCVDSTTIVQYLQSQKFIELKTNRHITNVHQDKSFKRYKTKKWWCQSFLVGIDRILCGFRDDKGIVEELRIFSVSEIAKMSKNFWDPNVCFNFLDTFLTFVKRCLRKKITKLHDVDALKDIQSLPLLSLMFEWNPRSRVHVSEDYNHNDDPILLDWFLENYARRGENNM